ncbi:nitroreductase family protein [Ihubacter massiliensis]|uniref:Nitroreductase family protein n=1 Tax=Hominibacterium faecale TaxID=2839743 RepID=A0A9J6QIC8_9FIRM|nr:MULTISPECIES: nitroreductase family protein [Eubacteriales Family XIII. Incertae Sedis]MCO7122996.1 nitroreductase family protein [Ihubacter massiliensis]MCU7377256.1 nitroreductase family protein [Hominibacterium faecale]
MVMETGKADQIKSIMERRCSCRAFSKRPVLKEDLEELLETAVKAPSSSGFQNYSIIVVEQKSIKKQLAELSGPQQFIANAPAGLIFCIDLRREKRIIQKRPSPSQSESQFIQFMMYMADAVICAQTFCLAAEEKGLGTVYIGNIIHYMERVSELLNLPQYVMPVIMVCAGYPRFSGKPSPKYPAEVLVHTNQYQDLPIEILLRAFDEKYKDWRMPFNERAAEQIARTAQQDQGENYGAVCREYLKKADLIGPYQWYYGCRYLKKDLWMSTEDYRRFMKTKGFTWIK